MSVLYNPQAHMPLVTCSMHCLRSWPCCLQRNSSAEKSAAPQLRLQRVLSPKEKREPEGRHEYLLTSSSRAMGALLA